jgi:ADP-heptose:LPS heptosyltransferase
MVARAYPDAERYVLTNFSVNDKAAPVAQILEGVGLVHGYLEYPIGVRDLGALWILRRRIRELRPDVLVYLAAPRGRLKAWRDALFFRACGIPRLIGVPFAAKYQRPLQLYGGRYEYEGARLARCIAALGDAGLNDPGAFELSLTKTEHQIAQSTLDVLGDGRPLLAVSIGAKDDVKDWGDTNWLALFERLGGQLPDWGLIMLGAEVERQRSAALLKHWPGDALNLCGRLSVRESAAALTHATLYCGHDSGPMHLAAAVGTPCVAIFSSRNVPGEWFPYGSQHRVIYHSIDCQGCRLKVCVKRNKACIRSITVDEVLTAVMQVLDQVAPSKAPRASDVHMKSTGDAAVTLTSSNRGN